MIEALAPLYDGPLSWLQDRALLTSRAPATTVAASELFTAAGLAEMTRLHATNYAPGDPRAVLSIWSKYYLATMVYTPFAALTLLGRVLPVALDQIGLVLGKTGEVWQLVLPHAGTVTTQTDSAAHFLPLLDANLTPAIAYMAAYSGLAPRVYWSNAGHYLDHLTVTLAAHADTAAAARLLAAFMQRRHLSDGRRNPLHRPVQATTDARGNNRRMRRLCCIRFRLPGVDYCTNCPLWLK